MLPSVGVAPLVPIIMILNSGVLGTTCVSKKVMILILMHNGI